MPLHNRRREATTWQRASPPNKVPPTLQVQMAEQEPQVAARTMAMAAPTRNTPLPQVNHGVLLELLRMPGVPALGDLTCMIPSAEMMRSPSKKRLVHRHSVKLLAD